MEVTTHKKNYEKRNWPLIFAVSSCLILVYVDQTGVSLTLNAIKIIFRLSSVAEQWIINSYTLSLAVFILISGKFGDVFGYRKMFLTGLVLFLLSSFSCGVSFSGTSLIISRVFQGIASSLIIANSVILIIENSEVTIRGRSVGNCIAIASCVGVFGPTIGGFFTNFFSWRYIFFLNIPISIVSIILILMSTSKDKIKSKSRIDWLGFITFTLGMTCLIVAIMEGEYYGWTSILLLSLFSISIAFFILFMIIEVNSPHPFINLSLFSSRKFSSSNLLLLFIQTCDISSAVFWVMYLQNSLGYSTWIAGLLILPVTIPGIYFSNLSGKLLDKYGPIIPTIIGTSLAFISVSWIAITAGYKNYWLLMPAFFAYGIGESLIIPATITSIISSVRPNDYGQASGIANTMRQIGGAIGFSIIGAVISGSQSGLFTHALNEKNITMVNNNLSTDECYSLYAKAFSNGMWVASFFSFLAFLLAWNAFGNKSKKTLSR